MFHCVVCIPARERVRPCPPREVETCSAVQHHVARYAMHKGHLRGFLRIAHGKYGTEGWAVHTDVSGN